jgi:hypothetical protein
VDERGCNVFIWIIEAALRIISPFLYKNATQHGFSSIAGDEKTKVPARPSSNCHWMELQTRAVIILSLLDNVTA